MKVLFVSYAFLVNVVTPCSVKAEFNVTTVIIVRHAEKENTLGANPSLSEVGKARAALLRRMLSESGITAIYVTEFVRTQETAQSLAQQLGLTVTQINASDVQKLVDNLLVINSGKTILVVGHSDTIPEIVNKLGGGTISPIGESELDNLFVVAVHKKGEAKVLKLKYGAKSSLPMGS